MPAITRSPNRKPRTRRVRRAREWDTKRERVVQEVATGATIQEAAIASGMAVVSIEKAAQSIPEFKASLEAAQRLAEERRAEAQGLIDAELPRVAREFLELGATAGEARLRGDIDYKLLKGRGVLEGEGVNVAVGVKVDITADDMAKAYREAKKALKVELE